MVNRSWKRFLVPLNGGQGWTKTVSGNFRWNDVDQVQIAWDTWDAGFAIYLDGVEFTEFTPGALPPAGPPPPVGIDPHAMRPRALLYIYDPIMVTKGSRRVSQVYGWGDARALAAEVVRDIRRSSHGLVDYQIVETVIDDQYPIHTGGFQYTDATYDYDVRHGTWDKPLFDYAKFSIDKGIPARIMSGDIDEVWVYGAPGFSFWESTMAGDGGYWCNSGPVQGVPSSRLYVIMGWNYERGVAEAIHSWAHRAESILWYLYGAWDSIPSNTWSKFALVDKDNPGQGGVGNCHYPVNATSDYDYYNPRWASSNCDDWYNYPNLKGLRRQVTRTEWSPLGVDPHREYLNWWYHHMPHMAGRGNDYFLANWWRYLVDVDQFKAKGGNLYWSTGIPTVQVASPAVGSEVQGKAILRANADSDGAMGRVDFYLDGAFVGSDALSPFAVELDTTGVPNGPHTLIAKAYDLQNGTEAVSAPVQFTVANAGKAVGGRIDLGGWSASCGLVPVQAEFYTGTMLRASRKLALGDDGSFGLTLDLPATTYKVVLRARRFLTRKFSMALGASGASGVNVAMVNGDIDGDDSVTVFDYGILSENFDRTDADPMWNRPNDDGLMPSDADLDGDGAVTVFDYGILSGNFDRTGDA